MIDEGYVKFSAQWQQGPAPAGIDALVAVRNQLFALGLIGEYPDLHIGYGNVSMRQDKGDTFYISGSATGSIATATAAHFCLVTGYEVDRNRVECIGPVTASSESMTHAMLYASSKHIGAVLHVHHLGFWESLLATAPSSSPDVAYGTPAMANEMARLMHSTDLPQRKLLAMAGHAEGIIAFGVNVAAAQTTLLTEFAKWRAEKGSVDKK
jgi:L-ribulose-5-phosphate 4-epimerase